MEDQPVEDALMAVHFLSLGTCLLNMKKLKQKRKHRFWNRKIFKDRMKYGYNATLIKELRSHDQNYYFDFMRMTPELFHQILDRVSPFIEKKNTFWRPSISPNERLALTLRFLATGETFRSLSFPFRIGRQTISKIIPETSEAIWNCFVNNYMKFPLTTAKWKEIALGFEKKWQLPHCCGSIDGKHVLRECPITTGSLNHNYKGTFSTVLLALADYNYRFLMIDYGHYGSESDGGIFHKSTFGQLLKQDKLNFPDADILTNSNKSFPYFVIGDEAFPLRHNLLRPFPRISAFTYSQQIYNYRLCRARRVVENAFGILTARFRIFKRPLNYSDATTEKIVLAACVLHNILIEESPAYCPKDITDIEGYQQESYSMECFHTIKKLSSNMYSQKVKELRDEYKNYLCNEGAVEWQDKMVNV